MLLALACTTAFSACDVSYDPETRYVIRTHLTDRDGNPLAGVKAGLTVSDDDASDLLSSGKTDANGNLTLVFPMAQNDATYRLRFKSPLAEFEEANFYNISDANFSANYTLVLDTHLDREGETLNLEIDYVQTGFEELVSAYLEGEIGSGNVDLSINQQPVSQARMYPNQTLLLHYVTRQPSGQTTEHIAEIEIDSQNVSFTLEY